MRVEGKGYTKKYHPLLKYSCLSFIKNRKNDICDN